MNNASRARRNVERKPAEKSPGYLFSLFLILHFILIILDFRFLHDVLHGSGLDA